MNLKGLYSLRNFFDFIFFQIYSISKKAMKEIRVFELAGGVEGVNEVMDDNDVEVNLVNLMGKNMNIAGGGGVDEKELEDELAALEDEMDKEKAEKLAMPDLPIPPTAKPVASVPNDVSKDGNNYQGTEIDIATSSTTPVSKHSVGSKLLSPEGKTNLGPPVRVALPS